MKLTNNPKMMDNLNWYVDDLQRNNPNRLIQINKEMKMAAVKALASLAKETVPEFVNIAYDKTKLTFGKNYIIPKPFDPRLITKIPPEVAKAAMKSGVAQEPIECWEKYQEKLHNRLSLIHI